MKKRNRARVIFPLLALAGCALTGHAMETTVQDRPPHRIRQAAVPSPCQSTSWLGAPRDGWTSEVLDYPPNRCIGWVIDRPMVFALEVRNPDIHGAQLGLSISAGALAAKGWRVLRRGYSHLLISAATPGDLQVTVLSQPNDFPLQSLHVSVGTIDFIARVEDEPEEPTEIQIELLREVFLRRLCAPSQGKDPMGSSLFCPVSISSSPDETVPSTHEIRLESSRQRFVWRLEVAQWQSFRWLSEGKLDTSVSLYDSASRQWAANDDGGEDLNFDLTALLSPGVHYLEVEVEPGSQDTFTLTFQRLPW